MDTHRETEPKEAVQIPDSLDRDFFSLVPPSPPLTKEHLFSLQAKILALQEEKELALVSADRQSALHVLGFTPRELADLAGPWEMYSAALRNHIGGGASSDLGVQLVTVPMSADWHDPRLGNYRAWRVLGDSLPTWNAAYRPTQIQLSSGYYLFITNLDIPIPNPDDRKKAENARKLYIHDNNNLDTLQRRVGPNWQSFDLTQRSLPVGRRMSFDQWYARFDGRAIAAQQDKVRESEQEYTAWLIKAYKGYAFVADILSNYNNPAFQGSAESPDGQVQFYRTYNITPDLGRWIETGKQLVAGNAPPKLSFAFSKDSTRMHTEETRWKGSASFFGGWFGFSAGASSYRKSVDITHEHFRMDFSVRNFDVFTVTPGQWFNGTAVKALQNGPWIQGGPIQSGNAKLWGPTGVLNLMPTQLVVGYRPTVSASIKKDEYHEIKSGFYASGGFSIGPFGFGASYSRDTSDVTFDDASNTVTASDISDVPQVMAVISSVLPTFS